MSDEDKVLAVIKDMCNKDHTVGMKHMHDNCVFVRPTGNPLNKKEWDNMMNNNDKRLLRGEFLGKDIDEHFLVRQKL